MSKSPLVPTQFFTSNVAAIYTGLLTAAGVKQKGRMTVHADSSVTITLFSEADAVKVRAIKGMIALTDMSQRGNITIVHAEAIAFLKVNGPKSGKKVKATVGPRAEMTPERLAEIENRKAVREQLAALLRGHGHGLDDETDADDYDESEGDDEADE